jgi:hypothetical protein
MGLGLDAGKFLFFGLDHILRDYYRKCPGMYFASKSLWIAMVRILWAFDIKPAVDKEGNTIQYSPDNCTSGVTW